MGWFGKKKDKDGNEIQISPREQAQKQLNNAVGAIYAVAILSAALGAIALIFQIEILLDLGLGIPSLIMGAIYGGLGFWVKRKHSVIGLGGAFGLYVVDGLAFIVANIDAGGRPTSGIAIRATIAYFMFLGFGAIKQLKSAKIENESAPDSPEAGNL